MSQPRFNPNTGQWEFPGARPPQPGNVPNGQPMPPPHSLGYGNSPYDHDRTDAVEPRRAQRPITMSERGSSSGPPPPPRNGSQLAQPASSGKPRRWPWITGIVAAFIVGTMMGAAGGGTDTGTATASGPAPVSASAPSPAAPVDPPAESPAPAAEPEPELFTSGTYIVGDEIAPGRYRTPGAVDAILPLCTASRQKDNGDLIGFPETTNDGPAFLTIKGSDGMVQFSGPCEWSPA